MASIINASTSTGLVTTADTSGVLQLQTAGTTALTVDASQNVTLANGTTIQGLTVGRGAGAVSTNTAVGASALAANTTGETNTASGYQALNSNLGGSSNTAYGVQAMRYSTTGGANAAYGRGSLYANTTGSNNVACGQDALTANTTASNNTAVGYQAGYSNTTGGSLTALGYQAGYSSTGNYNTFVGKSSGYTTTGADNTFIGHQAGYSVTTGSGNAFFGSTTAGSYGAGYSVTTGSKNTILGSYSGNQGGLDIRTASNYIVLSDGDGNPRGYWDATNWNFPSMYSQTTGEAVNLNVNSSGAVRRSTSSLRYKNTVNDATHGLTELLTLRPVTYKGNNDGDTVFGGLIAEEVHEAGLTEFVQLDAEGRPDALAYGNMVSLCIKAIQELKAEVDSLKAQINGASA